MINPYINKDAFCNVALTTLQRNEVDGLKRTISTTNIFTFGKGLHVFFRHVCESYEVNTAK